MAQVAIERVSDGSPKHWPFLVRSQSSLKRSNGAHLICSTSAGANWATTWKTGSKRNGTWCGHPPPS